MANSSCPKCGHHSFELAEANISGAKFKFYFVQCSKYGCGTVVGVVDYHHTGTKLDALQKSVDALKSSSSSSQMQQLAQNVNGLYHNIGVLNKKLDTLLEQKNPTE